MNRYLMVCRLRWPALLLLTGVIALLVQADMLTWGKAWPLYLILWGILALVERAALAAEQPPADMAYGTGYGAPGYATPTGGYPAVPPAPPTTSSTGIVPVHDNLDLEKRDETRADFRNNNEEEGR
jgi:hypothetical protein